MVILVPKPKSICLQSQTLTNCYIYLQCHFIRELTECCERQAALSKHSGWTVAVPDTTPVLSTQVSILKGVQSHVCLPFGLAHTIFFHTLDSPFNLKLPSFSFLPVKFYPSFKGFIQFHFFHEDVPRWLLPSPCPYSTYCCGHNIELFIIHYLVFMNLSEVRNYVLYFCISPYHLVQSRLYRCSINICFDCSRDIMISWSHCVICIFSESFSSHWSHYEKLNLCQKSSN